jgi:outer membrane protein
MKRIFTLAAVALSFVAATTVQAQKIAVVSADEIFVNMKETKKADTSLNIYQSTLQEELASMDEELNSQFEKFVKDSSKMSKEAKDAKRETLQKRINEMQQRQEDMNKSIEAKKDELLRPIREKMMKAVDDVAKQNGYAYVMYKEQLLVFPTADDITDKVKANLGIKK